MARLIERLTQTAIDAAGPGRYPDGAGLYLQVAPGGSKSWLFRYQFRGIAREMGLGRLSAFTIADARKRARAARQQIDAGVDPLEAKRASEATAAAARAAAVSFRTEAESYIAAHSASWRNDKHGSQWRRTLTAYVYPIIGDLPLTEVDTAAVLRVVEPLWSGKTETAHRVRGRIERILNRAASAGRRSGENPARWRGHLEHILPPRRRVAPVRHHPALPYAELGDFMIALRRQPGDAARALELLILTATRTTETIGSKPEEFDLPAAIWIIPGARTKSGREHRVPLSARACEIIRTALKPGAAWLFPGRDGRPMSNNALLALLKRMKRGDITAHGFRSTFRTWAAEQTAFPPELAEMALAHSIGDETVSAYQRSDLLARRAKLMQAWAGFCAKPSAKGADVVPMRASK